MRPFNVFVFIHSLNIYRRGEIVSEDEEDSSPRKRGVKDVGSQKPRSDAWKRPRKTKVRVEHQTYEQIIQGAAGRDAHAAGIGKIYDATSGEVCSSVDLYADFMRGLITLPDA